MSSTGQVRPDVFGSRVTALSSSATNPKGLRSVRCLAFPRSETEAIHIRVLLHTYSMMSLALKVVRVASQDRAAALPPRSSPRPILVGLVIVFYQIFVERRR